MTSFPIRSTTHQLQSYTPMYIAFSTPVHELRSKNKNNSTNPFDGMVSLFVTQLHDRTHLHRVVRYPQRNLLPHLHTGARQQVTTGVLAHHLETGMGSLPLQKSRIRMHSC